MLLLNYNNNNNNSRFIDCDTSYNNNKVRLSFTTIIFGIISVHSDFAAK